MNHSPKIEEMLKLCREQAAELRLISENHELLYCDLGNETDKNSLVNWNRLFLFYGRDYMNGLVYSDYDRFHTLFRYFCELETVTTILKARYGKYTPDQTLGDSDYL